MSSAPIEFTDRKPIKNIHLEHERLMDCIHCGLCLSHCPTYVETGQEADSPRGRIYLMRALYEGRIEPTPDVTEHLDLCLGCRACETACPSGVQYGYLIEGTRTHLRETDVPKSLKDRLILKGAEMTFPYPRRLELLLLPIRFLRGTGILSFLRKVGIMKLFGYMGDLEMLLPPLPAANRRHQFAEVWPAEDGEQAQVAMLTGCVMQVMQTHVNESTAKVLTRSGCQVWAPKSQACCGAMHAHTGAMDVAKALAKANIVAFEKWEEAHGKYEALIVNAAGCGSALKEYPMWFHGDAEWEGRAKRFAARVKDVSEFLDQPKFRNRLAVKMHKPALAKTDDETKAPVTYHDACHLAHGQGIRAAPRDLLSLIPGIDLVPLPESEMCCGSAGTYNITQPTMASQLLERKMKNVGETGANVCVTGNPGCAMQLMLGARKYGPPVEIKHPIELLDEATS